MVDNRIYDPMPGGSGLLQHLSEHWEEVRNAALELLDGCVSACETSCIDCLQTYRNRIYHEYLDRHKAAEILRSAAGPLLKAYEIPEHLSSVGGTGPHTNIEVRFRRFLAEAGLPAPICRHRIELGSGFLATIPDFFYNGEDDEPGICVYLDGMAGHIHGNDDQAEKDRVIRARLDSKGYEAVVVRSFELDDKNAVVVAIARIAKLLVGEEKGRAVKEDSSWFEKANADAAPTRTLPALRLIRCEKEETSAVPIYDLRIAAAAFSEGQIPEAKGYGRVDGAAAGRGLFVAQVVGDSMDKLAPKGAWCLWQHLGEPSVAATAPGENSVVRRPAGGDVEMGQFTFKRRVDTERRRALVPASTNLEHQAIPLGDEGEIEAVARFVAVVSKDRE